MAGPRTPLARAALVANGMVWFGASVMFFAIAGEQTYAAFTGEWFNVLGWALILAVAVAVVGVIENRNIRAGKKHRPRPRRR
ncbi:hypothetical protein [Rathayibacter sp. AY1D3]|uniref:hypothetical protein n=2 Tax=unclassified Rathayibacter TaxID=2609250 RepID=UPI0011B06AD0|nr:hypothetical protein [Rathayibacter sp. AY1D3]